MTVLKSQPHNGVNIYQMYEANKFKLNFFVKRGGWSETYAKIIDIEGVKEGENIQGTPPYFGNPKVTAMFFNEHTNKFINLGKLPCAGTYKYKMIDKPDNLGT